MTVLLLVAAGATLVPYTQALLAVTTPTRTYNLHELCVLQLQAWFEAP